MELVRAWVERTYKQATSVYPFSQSVPVYHSVGQLQSDQYRPDSESQLASTIYPIEV